jgi:hypothetical protein
MRLDDPRVDGLEVDHPRIALEMAAQPVAAVALDLGPRLGEHGPVVEHAVADREAGDVAPPAGLAVDHRDVARDVLAVQQRHPEVAGLLVQGILLGGADHPALGAHAAHVVDRLGEHRKVLGRHAVQAAGHALRFRDQELVVQPAVLWIELVGVAVLGRHEHLLGARDALEILHPPGVALDDRHGLSSSGPSPSIRGNARR